MRSLPFRETSFASPPPASPSNRYPSYLISKTHPARENGFCRRSACITFTVWAFTSPSTAPASPHSPRIRAPKSPPSPNSSTVSPDRIDASG